MNLYQKFGPVTWWVGVVAADLRSVAKAIQPLYIPNDVLLGMHETESTVDTMLESLVPLGERATKFLLVKTTDGRTAVFWNGLFAGGVEWPTWHAAQNLGVEGYVVCNVPNTISRDQKSGAWGCRTVEMRLPADMPPKEPTFGVHLVNDAGKWHFVRYGRAMEFENSKAYHAMRKVDRFTEQMLVDYCHSLTVPIYERGFYDDTCLLVEREHEPEKLGLNWEEAGKMLRFDRHRDAS